MFVVPEVNVMKFVVEDIITVSGNGDGNGGIQFPDEEL